MGRRWLITGCSSGLGRALAEAAAAVGDDLVVTARKTADLEDLVTAWPGRVSAMPLELRDATSCEQAVRAAADRLGGIDVLVNNAGSGLFGAVEETSDTELRDLLDVLLIGPWRLTRLVLPLMRAQGHGHILNVSSVAGHLVLPGTAAYSAAKQGLEAMSRTLAIEGAPHGVRVTVLQPGQFATQYGTAMTETHEHIAAYDVTNRDMLAAYRGLADDPASGTPEAFAARVLALVTADAPLPTAVPVGDDAFGYRAAAAEMAREELEAARTLG
ncbi:SDR family oxidoreductase [Streptomyces sp. YC504]|uniref:SDR family oxidoreductase n=1 Tax=Streptomyces mesophilus TaxID=1775132 RepID=A0A6G4XM04_9ACTN|nr:SDR family oxidoreductase [Streptomyces mesophilus]NGO78458.1 SDR family oxidoreductase [Streptomyces mesophilus]